MQTASERLVAEYFCCQRYTSWEHEPQVPGKRSKLDFRLRFNGADLYFEVKEFLPGSGLRSFGVAAHDPYRPVRERINEVRKQFREYKEFCCSLILHDCLPALRNHTTIVGSMLGNIVFRRLFDKWRSTLVGDWAPAFSSGGKMVASYQRAETQNTTVSAIIVLEPFESSLRKFRVSRGERERDAGRELAGSEFRSLAVEHGWRENGGWPEELRAVVYENPYARMPLPRDVLIGPLDERFGRDGDEMARVFVGDELRKLEESEQNLKRG